MGLGGGQSEWDDYVWFRAGTRGSPSSAGVGVSTAPGVPAARSRSAQGPDRAAAALVARVADDVLWMPGDATRILLVDLDNLRAGPLRWRSRMAVMVALARQADHVAFAGQEGAVRRARPFLEEYAPTAIVVPSGSDLADVALLELIDELDLPDAQALVVSNDGIFAELAYCGPLVVLSPGRNALSDALVRAAVRVVDLAALEEGVSTPSPAREAHTGT